MQYRLLLSGLALILVFTGCEIEAGEPTPPPFPRVGAEGKLDADIPELFIAADQQAYEEMLNTAGIRDTLGLVAMVAEDKIFAVQNGISVLILDSSTPFLENTRWRVRILEGSAIGRAGWVPEPWLAPISDQAGASYSPTPP